MSNGEDTIRVRTTDGQEWDIPRQQLPAAKARGAVEVSTRPSLWQAATTPMGRNIAEQIRQDIATQASYLPEPIRGPAAMFGTAVAAPFTSIAEAGRRMMTSPVGVATAGAGAAMQMLRAAPGASPLLKAGVGALETTAAGAFGTQGIMDMLAPGQPNETWEEAFERRMSGAGSALFGLAGVGHAVGPPLQKHAWIVGREIMNVPQRRLEADISAHQEKVEKAQEKYQLAFETWQNKIDQINEANRNIDETHQQNVQETGRLNDEAILKHKVAKEQALDAYQKELVAYLEKIRSASQEMSEAEVRKKTLREHKPGGPVRQYLNQWADTLVDKLVPNLRQAIRTNYNARWNAWRMTMGDAVVDIRPVQEAIEHARDNILKGSPENIRIFDHIMAEGEPEEESPLEQASVFRTSGPSVDIKEFTRTGGALAEGRPGAEHLRSELQKLIEAVAQTSGQAPPTGPIEIPVDDLRGYITELQRKMYQGTFTGDVYRALDHVYKTADGIVTEAATAKGTLPMYKSLKADWTQFMRDFYDKSAPLRMLKNRVNADKRVDAVTGDDSARIMQALGRYARFDTPTRVEIQGRPETATVIQMAGRILDMDSRLRSFATSARLPEAPPERPTMPKPPKLREVPERKPYKEAPEKPTEEKVAPFDIPAWVAKRVNARAEKLGMAGHTLVSYWIIRDIFHGQVPSPQLIASPFVQVMIMRYLQSPGFVNRITRGVMSDLPPEQQVRPGAAAQQPPGAAGVRPITPEEADRRLRDAIKTVQEGTDWWK
jgi:hypothetical protein